jgi:stress response protein SCP2
MSMTKYVQGIVPPDEKFKKMLALYRQCEEANVSIPKEVRNFFNNEEPNEAGVMINLKALAKEDGDDSREWIDVDLTKLPPEIKKIRFVMSW